MRKFDEKKLLLNFHTDFRSPKILDLKKNNNSSFLFYDHSIKIFGCESAGVPKYVHQSVNEQLTIPMVKGLRSINVSSSVAIVAGEACRQLNRL